MRRVQVKEDRTKREITERGITGLLELRAVFWGDEPHGIAGDRKFRGHLQK